jgi:hypothetical protein
MKKLSVIFMLVLLLVACVPNTDDPVISVVGDEELTLFVGDIYYEKGAIISGIDEPGLYDITIGGDAVDTAVVGEYTVTYSFEYEGEVYTTSRIVHVVLNQAGMTFSENVVVVNVTSTSIAVSVEITDLDMQINSANVYLYESGIMKEMMPVEGNSFAFTFDFLNPETVYTIVFEAEYFDGMENQTYSTTPLEVTTLEEQINVDLPNIVLDGGWIVTESTIQGDFNEFIDPNIESYEYTVSIYNESGSLISQSIVGSVASVLFEYLDAETNYTIGISIDYTVAGDSSGYFLTLLEDYVTTDAEEVVDLVTVSDVSYEIALESLSASYTINDPNGYFISSYVALRDGAGNELETHTLGVGTNGVIFTTTLVPNVEYSAVLYVSYFDESYNMISNEIFWNSTFYVEPTFTITSVGLEETTYENMDAVVEVSLNNPSNLDISKVVINGIEYTDFVISTDHQSVLVNLGVLAIGSYDYGVVSVYYSTLYETNSVDSTDDLVFDVLEDPVPSNAGINIDVLSLETPFFEISSASDPVTFVLEVYLENPYELNVNYLVINGDTYDTSMFTVDTDTFITVPVVFTNDYMYYHMTIDSIGYTKNGNAVMDIPGMNNTITGFGHTNVSYIYTPFEFSQIGQYNAYVLMNDIDMTGYQMANDFDGSTPFSGMLYGNGYTVSNLQLDPFKQASATSLLTGATSAGALFNNTQAAYIGDITFSNVLAQLYGYDNSATYMGGLVGYSHLSYFYDVTVNTLGVNVFQPGVSSYFGGLVGYASATEFNNIEVTSGNIYIDSPTSGFESSSSYTTGGIVGYMIGDGSTGTVFSSKMNRVSYTGNITSEQFEYSSIGGIIGTTRTMLGLDAPIQISNVLFHGFIENYGFNTGGILANHQSDAYPYVSDTGFINKATFIGTIFGASQYVAGIAVVGNLPINNIVIDGTLASGLVGGEVYYVTRNNLTLDFKDVSNAFYTEDTTCYNGGEINGLDYGDPGIMEMTMLDFDSESFYSDTVLFHSMLYNTAVLDYNMDVFITIIH